MKQHMEADEPPRVAGVGAPHGLGLVGSHDPSFL